MAYSLTDFCCASSFSNLSEEITGHGVSRSLLTQGGEVVDAYEVGLCVPFHRPQFRSGHVISIDLRKTNNRQCSLGIRGLDTKRWGAASDDSR